MPDLLLNAFDEGVAFRLWLNQRILEYWKTKAFQRSYTELQIQAANHRWVDPDGSLYRKKMATYDLTYGPNLEDLAAHRMRAIQAKMADKPFSWADTDFVPHRFLPEEKAGVAPFTEKLSREALAASITVSDYEMAYHALSRIRRDYYAQVDHVSTLRAASTNQFIGATLSADGRCCLRSPSVPDPVRVAGRKVRGIQDEKLRYRYFCKLLDPLYREAEILKEAALEAARKRERELLLEYDDALKALDKANVFPEEWSHFHRTHFADDWYAIFSREVVEHLNTVVVASMYPGEGKTGRPPTDPVVMCALLFIKKKFNLTYELTSTFLMSNAFFQLALGLEPFSRQTYVCSKTIATFEKMMAEKKLTSAVYGPLDAQFIKKYGPDCRVLRGDTTNVQSNMKKLNRLTLMFDVVRRALDGARKSDPELYALIPREIKERYAADKKWVNVFSLVHHEWSTTSFTEKLADDMYTLLTTQGNRVGAPVNLKSWHTLARVFGEQCEVVTEEPTGSRGSGGKGVGARPKPGKEVPANAVQNPSDPDATYNAKKGPGFNVGLLENWAPKVRKGVVRGISLILFADVMPANVHDSEFFALFMDFIDHLLPEVVMLLLDGAFGRQKNYELARDHGIDLLSLVCGSTPGAGKPAHGGCGIPLDSFKKDSDGKILACPCGRKATTTFRDNKDGRVFTARFCRGACAGCARSAECPVSVLKTTAVLRYTKTEMGLAIRRTWQRSDWFKENYRPRSGVEASIQKLKKMLLRYGKLSVRGLLKVRHSIALAVRVENFNRVVHYRKEVTTLAGQERRRLAKLAA
jgi:hypothetical protein